MQNLNCRFPYTVNGNDKFQIQMCLVFLFFNTKHIFKIFYWLWQMLIFDCVHDTSLMFLAFAVVTPVLRPHFIKSKCWGQQPFWAESKFSFLYWCIRKVPQGNPWAWPPSSTAWVLVGRDKQQPAPAGGPGATAAAAAAAVPPTGCSAKQERSPSLCSVQSYGLMVTRKCNINYDQTVNLFRQFFNSTFNYT